jgi:hypothetical protein
MVELRGKPILTDDWLGQFDVFFYVGYQLLKTDSRGSR